MPRSLSPADVPRAGLRERKKLKTRLAIQEHALRLFEQRGYDRTTVEQIAEAAEISPSTFFRYFPSKEDVVLFDALDPWLIESFRRQPPELTPIAALRAALHEVFNSLSDDVVAEQRQRARLVLEVPALQAAWIGDIIRTAGFLQEMIAERVGKDPGDPRVRVYTGAVMGAIMGAMAPMFEDPETDFVADVDAALDFLAEGLVL